MSGEKSHSLPPEIRKACVILGLPPEQLTRDALDDKWRRVAAVLRRHPTLGKAAKLSLAAAKDTIVKWFEDSSSSGPH